MANVSLRPMTAAEYGPFRSRLIKEYAADHVKAGDWAEGEAEGRATADMDSLLPGGPATPGHLVLAAENPGGEFVGHVWVGLQRAGSSAEGAWIYDIEVRPEHQGKGYGRALLAAAEEETARRGVAAIGLNVFGPNTVARRLYESAGYETTFLQMRKTLLAG